MQSTSKQAFEVMVEKGLSVASARELTAGATPPGKRAWVADNAAEPGVVVWAAAMAREVPELVFFLLTDNPSCYLDVRDWPNNVWLGVRACTQQEVHEQVRSLVQFAAREKRWLSCTPRDMVTLTPGVHWVYCNGEELAKPLYPPAVKQLRDSCAAQKVPFYFEGWDGWYETHRNMEPYVSEGDALVQLDGAITGKITEVRRDPAKGDKIVDMLSERMTKRNRDMGREITMRRDGKDAPATIGGKLCQDLPR